MPRHRFFETNFTGGELSPKLRSRTNVQEYVNGLEKLENYIVDVQGGARRRPGTQFVTDKLIFLHLENSGTSADTYFSNFGSNTETGKQSDIDSNIKLVPFIRPDGKSLMLVFYADGTKTGLAAYDPRAKTSIRCSYENGFSGLTGTNDFLGVENASDLDDLRWVQKEDEMYFAHKDYHPFFVRITQTSLESDEYIIEKSPLHSHFVSGISGTRQGLDGIPLEDINPTTTDTLNYNSGTGEITAVGINLFSPDDIGTVVRIDWNPGGGDQSSYYIIDSFTDERHVDVTLIIGDTGTTSAVSTWYLSAWRKPNGYPSSVAYYENRIIYGGSKKFPDSIWGSFVGELHRFRSQRNADSMEFGDVTNARAYRISLATEEPNKIQWMSGRETLLIGTDRSEIRAFGTSVTLGPADANFETETNHGSHAVDALRVDNTAMFVDRSQRNIRRFIFNEREQAFTAPSIGISFEHLFRISPELFSSTDVPSVKEFVHQRYDTQIIWVLDDSGFLFAFTNDKEVGVVAAHRHDFGGTLSSGRAEVLSIGALPSVEGKHDDLYLVVKRTVNGAEQIYLEKMGKEFLGPSIYESGIVDIEQKPVFSDSAIMYLGEFDWPSDLVFYSSLKGTYETRFKTTHFDADYAVGSVTPDDVDGSSLLQDGTALFGSGVGIDYSPTSNFPDSQTFTVRFSAKTDPDISPAVDLPIFDFHCGGNVSRVVIFRGGSGGSGVGLTANIYDNAGTLQVTLTDAATTLADTDFHVIELGSDAATGEHRLFVDGVEIDNDLSTTFTRTGATATQLLIDNTFIGQIRDLEIYDTLKNSANYTSAGIPNFSRSAPFTTVNNLDHLEGQTVQVVADGKYVGEKTVSSGAITLDTAASEAIVGLQYKSTMTSMPINAGSAFGTAQGAIQRIDRVIPIFDRTIGAKIGPDENSLDDIVFDRPSGVAMGDPIPLFTGEKIIQLDSGQERRAQVTIQQELPLPHSVLGIVFRGITYD